MAQTPQRPDDRPPGDTQALIDFLRDHSWPYAITLPEGHAAPSDGALVALPRELRLESLKPYLDQWREQPERRSGTAELQDLASLIGHANRFKDGGSILYGYVDPVAPRLLAILDYHPAGPIGAGSQRWGQHRASYRFPLSQEWQAWLKMDGKLMDQGDFAAFLEDRLPDVIEPPPSLWRATVAAHAQDSGQAPLPQDQGGDFGGLTADERLAMIVAKLASSVATPQKLLELSRGLTIHAEETVTSAVNLQSGEGEIRFAAAHKTSDGQPVKVPGLFLVAIPIFQSGERWRLLVRLRYRKRGQQLAWGYEIYERDRALDTAIREACAQAARETGLPLLYGRPEGGDRG